MRLIQYSIAWFASLLMVVAAEQTSIALTIIPSLPGATEYWQPISFGFGGRSVSKECLSPVKIVP